MDKRNLIILFFLISFTSCGPKVTFENPQPEDIKNLAKFPRRIKGLFISLDNKRIEITDDAIIQTYEIELKEHKNKLDSNLKVMSDSVLDLNTNHKEKVIVIGDSILIRLHYIDTLFQISPTNLVRKFKGYYFLNSESEFGWEVKKLEVKKSQLRISRIDTKEDIENLVALSDSKQDTMTNHNIKITRKQFRKYIRQNGFDDTETYIKIKNAP